MFLEQLKLLTASDPFTVSTKLLTSDVIHWPLLVSGFSSKLPVSGRLSSDFPKNQKIGRGGKTSAALGGSGYAGTQRTRTTRRLAEQNVEHFVSGCSSFWLPSCNIAAGCSDCLRLTEGSMEQPEKDLNLSFLLEHERDMILKVLQKDEKLRKREEKRIRWGLRFNSCSPHSDFS